MPRPASSRRESLACATTIVAQLDRRSRRASTVCRFRRPPSGRRRFHHRPAGVARDPPRSPSVTVEAATPASPARRAVGIPCAGRSNDEQLSITSSSPDSQPVQAISVAWAAPHQCCRPGQFQFPPLLVLDRQHDHRRSCEFRYLASQGDAVRSEPSCSETTEDRARARRASTTSRRQAHLHVAQLAGSWRAGAWRRSQSRCTHGHGGLGCRSRHARPRLGSTSAL